MGDYRKTMGEPPPLTKRDQKRLLRKTVLFGLAGVALVVAFGSLIRINRYVSATGYISAEPYAEIRPAVQGSVNRILARSGADVQADELLVQLADEEEKAARDEAVSHLHKTEAELARREAEMAEERRQRESQIAVAKLRLEHAAAKLQLTRELSAKGLASGSALEDAKLGENLARAELDTLQKLDPTLPEKELDVMRRERDAAADAVAMADARLRSRQVRAPFAGRVVRYSFVVGELVKPDNVLYELFGREETVLKLRVPERYATLVATGQTYRAQLLPYRHSLLRRWFRGTVTELRDVIETENKTTYRVAYCRFDAQGEDVPPGTTAEAQIRVGRTPLWKTVLGLY